MRIAVLSGKGGTGKTFVSVNLACAGQNTMYIDCDVEEPNGHLFLKPVITDRTAVTVSVPQLDADRCKGCRECVEFCNFNALAFLQNRPVLFQEVCHSCGGCILFCPEKALVERKRVIGMIEAGNSGQVKVLTGCLNTGETSGVPIIKKLIQNLPQQGTAVLDCPPGSACIVMESIRKAEFCVLVAEPTLFGVHNLELVYDLVKLFHKPFGVVLNKCLPGENPAEQFCIDRQIPILARIPYEKELAELNASGFVASRKNARYRTIFQKLQQTIEKESES